YPVNVQIQSILLSYFVFFILFFFSSSRRYTISVSAFLLNRSSDLGWTWWQVCSKIITSILSFISGRLTTKSNQIKQLIRNGRSASLQRTFKKSFTSFSHSTRNKTRDGLIRVRRSEERRVGTGGKSRRARELEEKEHKMNDENSTG